MSRGLTAPDLILETPLDLFWYYPLDTTRFDINNLDDLSSRLNSTLSSLSNNPSDAPFFEKTAAIGPLDALTGYNNRIDVVRIPLSSLTYLTVALVLFFVSLMTGLLVDQQAEAIAMLRSRGGSRRQVFGALTVQSLAVGLVALLAGPLLAIVAARFMAQATLVPSDQDVISLITHNPVQVAWELRWSALLTIGVAVLAMILSLSRAIRMDVLSIRRESARSTHQPFWQRMHLDVAAAVVALVAYGFSVYVTGPGVLDDRVRVLILPATTVVGALFLLLGCTLLLLRFFPSILRLASRLASRSRGATPMLAIAQMARAPRQALRMTTLLALALAFTIFTLSFTASQTQRIPDAAAYQVGSDFSGAFELGTIASFDSWQQQEAGYRHIPGVTSATIGYVNFVSAAEGSLSSPIDLRVMNAASYAQTTIWTAQDSSQSAASLMQQLIANRSLAASGKAVPAIVDAATWNSLHLAIGSHFTINDVNDPVNVLVVAEADHIPT
ncbi:MAG TPA: FtsX-like permease family protein, partial [Ktedonobacteraceae bacterium]|nr:FtsX-like permease family protein [Ktedonobacteraceae bacterium]